MLDARLAQGVDCAGPDEVRRKQQLCVLKNKTHFKELTEQARATHDHRPINTSHRPYYVDTATLDHPVLLVHRLA